MADISVVGITDRGVESLLPEARSLVAGAVLLCGGERHLAFFPEHAAARFAIKGGLDALYQQLEAGPFPAVVLASGDPDLYGIGPLLMDRFGTERVQIVPNLSAVQLAFARLGRSWQNVLVCSAHGRPLESILPQALFAPSIAVLTDERNTPAAIARALLEAGDEDAEAHVFEHLDGLQERHVAGRLSDLVDQEFAPLNILVVLRREQARLWPLGLPEEAFRHLRGQITKAEVRAVTLSKLLLHPQAVVWDVGAGCGSVSIEASALAAGGQVYAVERDPDQLVCLRVNCSYFGAGNVTIVAGEAPGALEGLPAPDAVFIGGSGGLLDSVLETAMAALAPGGTLVLNLVALEHLTLCLAKLAGWDPAVAQVSVARGADVAGLLRLEALNPVFVVSATKPEGATG